MPPQPLRTFGHAEEGTQSPEALLISALLESGEFLPSRYHVGDDDIGSWHQLWKFAVDYQQSTGEAPPVSLIRQRHPDFSLISDVNPSWAATQVREAAALRMLRERIGNAFQAIKDEDLQAALAQFEGLKKGSSTRREPLMVKDQTTVTEDFEPNKIEVPYEPLGRATGGIGPGELWIYGARLGQGKSWVLCDFAARAALVGCSVCFVSLEMPAKEITKRIQARLAGRNQTLFGQLTSASVSDRKLALDQIALLTPGNVAVYDPSYGVVNTVAAIEELCQHHDLVIVDHIGLLVTGDRRRAVEDWRAQAVISNELKQVALSTATPILASSQVNREGERPESKRPPKMSNLSNADTVGQDADIGITMKRRSERVMIHSAEKVRNGPNISWYTKFEPGRNGFEVLSKDDAEQMIIVDTGRATFID